MMDDYEPTRWERLTKYQQDEARRLSLRFPSPDATVSQCAKWIDLVEDWEHGTVTTEQVCQVTGWRRPESDKESHAYTVEIEAQHPERGTWQALLPAETITTDNDSARHVALDVASNQNVADGVTWRVRVWHGTNADVSSPPDAEIGIVEELR